MSLHITSQLKACSTRTKCLLESTPQQSTNCSGAHYLRQQISSVVSGGICAQTFQINSIVSQYDFHLHFNTPKIGGGIG